MKQQCVHARVCMSIYLCVCVHARVRVMRLRIRMRAHESRQDSGLGGSICYLDLVTFLN